MRTHPMATLGISLLLALLATPAAAQSVVGYTAAGQAGPVPADQRSTTTKLRYEFYNNANALIGTSLCNAPTIGCSPRLCKCA